MTTRIKLALAAAAIAGVLWWRSRDPSCGPGYKWKATPGTMSTSTGREGYCASVTTVEPSFLGGDGPVTQPWQVEEFDSGGGVDPGGLITSPGQV